MKKFLKSLLAAFLIAAVGLFGAVWYLRSKMGIALSVNYAGGGGRSDSGETPEAKKSNGVPDVMGPRSDAIVEQYERKLSDHENSIDSLGDIDSRSDVVAHNIHLAGNITAERGIYVKKGMSVFGNINAQEIYATDIDVTGNIDAGDINAVNLSAVGNIGADNIRTENFSAVSAMEAKSILAGNFELSGEVKAEYVEAGTFSLQNSGSRSGIDVLMADEIKVHPSAKTFTIPLWIVTLNVSLADDSSAGCYIGAIKGKSVELTNVTADEVECDKLVLHGKSRVRFARANDIVLLDDSIVDDSDMLW